MDFGGPVASVATFAVAVVVVVVVDAIIAAILVIVIAAAVAASAIAAAVIAAAHAAAATAAVVVAFIAATVAAGAVVVQALGDAALLTLRPFPEVDVVPAALCAAHAEHGPLAALVAAARAGAGEVVVLAQVLPPVRTVVQQVHVAACVVVGQCM